MLSVKTAGLGMVFLSVAGMPVRGVGVMRGLLVVTGFVMLGGFAMMLGGMLVMVGGLVMVLDACVIAHGCSPGWWLGPSGLRRASDNVLTATRQLCCSRDIPWRRAIPSVTRRFQGHGIVISAPGAFAKRWQKSRE